MLFLHRILHRFFTRLRANLRTEDARPFRERNPRVSKALTSRYAPAIGASLAGFALGVYPESQLRISVALYTATKSLEFLYNLLEDKGYFANRPSWFGSWLLMPLSGAQLFHAFIYDRETIPKVRVDDCIHETFEIANSKSGSVMLSYGSPQAICTSRHPAFSQSINGRVIMSWSTHWAKSRN